MCFELLFNQQGCKRSALFQTDIWIGNILLYSANRTSGLNDPQRWEVKKYNDFGSFLEFFFFTLLSDAFDDYLLTYFQIKKMLTA